MANTQDAKSLRELLYDEVFDSFKRTQRLLREPESPEAAKRRLQEKARVKIEFERDELNAAIRCRVSWLVADEKCEAFYAINDIALAHATDPTAPIRCVAAAFVPRMGEMLWPGEEAFVEAWREFENPGKHTGKTHDHMWFCDEEAEFTKEDFDRVSVCKMPGLYQMTAAERLCVGELVAMKPDGATACTPYDVPFGVVAEVDNERGIATVRVGVSACASGDFDEVSSGSLLDVLKDIARHCHLDERLRAAAFFRTLEEMYPRGAHQQDYRLAVDGPEKDCENGIYCPNCHMTFPYRLPKTGLLWHKEEDCPNCHGRPRCQKCGGEVLGENRYAKCWSCGDTPNMEQPRDESRALQPDFWGRKA